MAENKRRKIDNSNETNEDNELRKFQKSVLDFIGYEKGLDEYLKSYRYAEKRKNDIVKRLERKKHNFLMKFWKSLNQRNKSVSKSFCIEELACMFIGKHGNIEKRKLEKGNISEIMDNDFQFIKLCDIRIPADVIYHILSFLKYDKCLLFDVGRICKMLYISILSPWKEVVIKKKNVFKISILVLKSVKSITFREDYDIFRLDEIYHILENLHPNRIRKITFKLKFATHMKILRSLYRKRKKLPDSMKSITSIENESIPPSLFRKSDAKDIICKKKLLLNEIWPNLVDIKYPLKRRFLEGLNLKRVYFYMGQEKMMIKIAKDSLKVDLDSLNDNNNFSKMKIKKLGINFCKNGVSYENLSPLELKKTYRFMNEFAEVENFEIVRGRHICWENTPLDFSSLSFRNLSTIKIRILSTEIDESFIFPTRRLINEGFWKTLRVLWIEDTMDGDGVNLDVFLDLMSIKNINNVKIPIRIHNDKITKNWNSNIDQSDPIFKVFSSIEEDIGRFEYIFIVFNWIIHLENLPYFEVPHAKIGMEIKNRKNFWSTKKITSTKISVHSCCKRGFCSIQVQDVPYFTTILLYFLPKVANDILFDQTKYSSLIFTETWKYGFSSSKESLEKMKNYKKSENFGYSLRRKFMEEICEITVPEDLEKFFFMDISKMFLKEILKRKVEVSGKHERNESLIELEDIGTFRVRKR